LLLVILCFGDGETSGLLMAEKLLQRLLERLLA
jgi:hypothetical protein